MSAKGVLVCNIGCGLLTGRNLQFLPPQTWRSAQAVISPSS